MNTEQQPDGTRLAWFIGQDGWRASGATETEARANMLNKLQEYWDLHNPEILDAAIDRAMSVTLLVCKTADEYLAHALDAVTVYAEDYNRRTRRQDLLSPFNDLDDLCDYYRIDVGDDSGGFWEDWDGGDTLTYDYTRIRLRTNHNIPFPAVVVLRPSWHVHADDRTFAAWPLEQIAAKILG